MLHGVDEVGSSLGAGAGFASGAFGVGEGMFVTGFGAVALGRLISHCGCGASLFKAFCDEGNAASISGNAVIFR